MKIQKIIAEKAERLRREQSDREAELRRDHKVGLHSMKNVQGCPICRAWLELGRA